MPQAQLTSVGGQDGESMFTGPVIQDVLNSTTTAIATGTLVAIVTPITTTTTTQFTVATATSVNTTAPLNIGIVVGSAGLPASGYGQVVTHGHVRALVDSTTTPTVVGHRLIIGGTTPGTLSDAGSTTAAAGLNYGVVLEALTTVTAGTLVNIWFEKT